MTTIIRVQDVKKSFSQGEQVLDILKGVSLEVRDHETVAIMGRSGSGKSTLISLMAGLDAPSTGEVEILGRSLQALSNRDLNQFRARHIGIIFQQFHLLDHLTALENVRLPMDLARQREADDCAEDVLRKVGLGHRLNHFPSQMSRGECQRVAIARVLVMKPEILLADEPTGSLDVKTGREVMELLLSLVATEKIALVMATHDPKVAERCTRRLYMNEGHLTVEPPEGFFA